MVKLPLAEPATVGVNVTLTVQLAPTAKESPQLVVFAKSPVVAMLAMFRLAPP